MDITMVGAGSIAIIGCGWLGLPLAEHLIRLGYTVHGTTTTESKLPILADHGIIAHHLDLSADSHDDILEWLSECDTVVISIPPGRRRADVADKYPKEIKSLIDMCEQSEISRLVYISSTGVYGEAKGEIDESYGTNPVTNSAKAVLAAEQIVGATQIDHAIIRMAGLVGPGRIPGRFFAGRGEITDGDRPVNMIHLDDCIHICHRIIESSDLSATILNACADLHPSRREFYTQHMSEMGVKPLPTFLSGGADSKVISNELLKMTLDYQFEHPDPMLF